MNFKTIKFSKDKISYIAPTWEEMNQLVFLVAKKIIEARESFDRIVTLAKGGWPMTRSLTDFLLIGKVASIGVKFYCGINKRLSTPQIYQHLPVKIKGEKILLFDDVTDTGGSLQFAKDYLLKHGIGYLKTATLFYKPHSFFKPDFYGAKTKAWIVFPYDAIESLRVLGKEWRKKGVGELQIKKRFIKLGFSKEWINYYTRPRKKFNYKSLT